MAGEGSNEANAEISHSGDSPHAWQSQLPETTSETDLLWFSRGRGWGHAVPDMLLLQQFTESYPKCRVRVASYADGAEVFRRSGWEVIDLALPRNPAPAEFRRRAGQVIERLTPHMLVSREEFQIPELAAARGLRNVVLTHWFLPSVHPSMAALTWADLVVFLEDFGVFSPPEWLRPKVFEAGPVCRRLSHPAKRSNADLRRVIFALGARLRADPPQVLPRLRSLLREGVPEQVYTGWLGNEADEDILRAAGLRHHFHDFGFRRDSLAEFAAATCVITSGTYNTLLELELLEIPSYRLTVSENPIDEAYAKQRRWSRILSPDATVRSLLTGLEASHLEEPSSRGGHTKKDVAETPLRVAHALGRQLGYGP